MNNRSRISDSIIIRQATPLDANLLASLGAQTFSDTFGPQNKPEDMAAYLAEAFDPDLIQQELTTPGRTYFIALLGIKPVGYVKLRSGVNPEAVRGQDPVELERIYVLAAYAGRGIGSLLKDYALSEARSQGFKTIWLGVWKKNEEAVKVYSRWGFEIVGEQTFTLGQDIQFDWIMARPVEEV